MPSSPVRLKAVVRVALAAVLSACLPAAHAQPPVFGPELQGFPYPAPLRHFAFTSQGVELQMAYMDVPPRGHANGSVAVLMHGKNFCGATWESQIAALSEVGWRVVVPDQVGFCASTKPAHYQYTFQQLAANTRALLDSLGVARATLVAHSTGGMIAVRYALMYPQSVERLVLVDPIGLEDWKALGVPWRSVEAWNARELRQSADAIRKYEQSTYYAGEWKPAYQRWVDMLAGLNAGPGHAAVAWNSALIYDMIFTQPVFYELPQLAMPVSLMIGTADTTAIGSDIAPPEVKARIGHYDVLGKQAAARIPDAHLVEFPGLGHAPQIQRPDEFNRRLLEEVGGSGR